MIVGVVMIGIVLIVIRVANVKSASARNGLLGIALFKTTIMLAGFGFFVPAIGMIWTDYRSQMLPLSQVGPALLIWIGFVLIARRYFANRALQSAQGTAVDGSLTMRAEQAVDSVTTMYQNRKTITCQSVTCSVPVNLSRPDVLVSTTAKMPAIADSASPTVIILPERVVEQLDDAELEGVVAHEMAHVVINRTQGGCTPGWARFVRWTNPLNLVFARLMRREEEMACDEVAGLVTGNPEALASALLKTHRMARTNQPRVFAPLSGLTIKRAFLRQRVSALLDLGEVPVTFRSPGTTVAWLVVITAAFVL
ncbi:MAG: M56 family metallopeptidase [Dehalococcoidia bacterium]